jgi:hypothetical protein
LSFSYHQSYSCIMTMRKCAVFGLSLLFCSLGFAYVPKEGQVNAFLGPSVYQTDYDKSRLFHDERAGGGVGLLVTGDISNKGAIEISMFHLYKTYFREKQDRVIAEKTELIHISMGYRWWLTEMFSASLSFYSAYSMGKKRGVYSDLLPTDDVPTSAADVTEYGFDLAFQTELWSDQVQGIVLDSRYSASVTNKTREYGNHYGFFLAYRRTVQ